MPDQRGIARTAGLYAVSKIRVLQRGYTSGTGPSASRARASLAGLRRLSSLAGSPVLENGELLFDGWPEQAFQNLGARESDKDRAFAAVKGVLNLYAIHQQSLSGGCAILRASDESDEDFARRRRNGTFGKACREACPDLDAAAGIQRRLAAVAAASDMDCVLYGMRALIRLIKSGKGTRIIRLDYVALTEDLYLIQLSGQWRRSVFYGWARDYFQYRKVEVENQ